MAILTTAGRVFGVVAMTACLSLSALAADPATYLPGGNYHRLLNGDFPPGAIGQARLAGRGPVVGYYQPVSIRGPQGTHFALPTGGSLTNSSETLHAGLLVGAVYRFQISQIPGAEGAELFPTIEVIDRTYPPPGMATRFPIEILLDEDDFRAALGGRMVTRVIYLEDPETATPLVQTPQTNRPLEISDYQDALEVADHLGRPVAIVRIGSVAPPSSPALLPGFFFGYPVWAPFVHAESTTAERESVAQP